MRLIPRLYYPEDSSLNHYIDSDLCLVWDASLDQVIDSLSSSGPVTLLGKIDIENL